MKFIRLQVLAAVVFALASAMCACDEGKPSQHELERRAISNYTKDVSSYTDEISRNLKNIEWAGKRGRSIRKGKTWVFTSSDSVIRFDSVLTYHLPDNLRGYNLAEVRTVVIIGGEPKVVGYYGSQNGSDRVDAVQYDRSITFVDAETMKIVKKVISEGSTPPASINYRSGNKPEQVSGGSYSPDEIIATLSRNLL